MKNKYLYLFGILITILAIYLSQSNLKILSFSITVIFIGIVAVITIKREFIFLFVLFIFFFFPQMNRYEILPVLNYIIGFVILGILFLVLIGKVELKSSYNLLWIIFIIYIIFQIIRGIYADNNTEFILDETVKYLFYPIGFYFTISACSSNNISKNIVIKLFKFTLIMGVVIVIQMLFYYFFITGANRVLTRQANLLLLSLMTSLTLLIFKRNLSFRNKITLLIFSFLYVIGILIFMQRSLWIAAITSVFVFILIFLFKSGIKSSKKIILILLITLFIFGSLFMFKVIAKSNKILEARTSEIQEEGVETFSIAVRIISYLEIINKIKDDWIIGLGVGDEISTPYLNRPVMNIVDNSYLVILWKFGVLGFLLFSTIFSIAIYQMIYLIKNTQGNSQLFAIIVFTNLMGQLVNGLACVIMILYFYNFIWVSQIAIINILYLKKKNTKINNRILS